MDDNLEQLAYEGYCKEVPPEMSLERQLAQFAEHLDGARREMEFRTSPLPFSDLSIISPWQMRSLADRALVQLLRDMLQALRHKQEKDHAR